MKNRNRWSKRSSKSSGEQNMKDDFERRLRKIKERREPLPVVGLNSPVRRDGE